MRVRGAAPVPKTVTDYLQWGVAIGTVSLGLTGMLCGAVMYVPRDGITVILPSLLCRAIAGGIFGALVGGLLGALFGALGGWLSSSVETGVELLSQAVFPARSTELTGTPTEVSPAEISSGRGSETAPAG